MKTGSSQSIIFHNIALEVERKTLLDFTFTAPQLTQCYFETGAVLQTQRENRGSQQTELSAGLRVPTASPTLCILPGGRLTRPNSKSQTPFKITF